MSTEAQKFNKEWPAHLQSIPFNDEEKDRDEELSLIASYYQLEVPSVEATKTVTADAGTLEYECQSRIWGRIQSVEEAFGERYSTSRILALDANDHEPTIIGRLANEIADKLQFPGNTAYLHGLGVLSSALVVNFRIQFYSGFTPVCMYVVSAQPPGTAKSPVNDIFIGPINDALEVRGRRLAAFHKIHESSKLDAQEKMKKTKGESDMRMIFEQIHEADAALSRKPPVGSAMKNITPEAAEVTAKRQHGVINIVSDESEALESAMGSMYQSEGKGSKANNGVFLAAFDGGRMSVGRVSREGMEGAIRGAFCVLAQDAAIKAIIQKGAEGRGVTERALILRERSLQGSRVWKRYEENTFDTSLLAEYAKLCEAVLDGEYPITIKVSVEIMDLLIDLRNQLEPSLKPGNKYSGDQVKGAASKLDKQILKMASVFHVAHHWSGKAGATRSLDLDIRFVRKAMIICMDLLHSYTTLVEAFGEDTASRQAVDVFRTLQNASKAGKLHITFDQLRSNIKNHQWYKDLDNKAEFMFNLVQRFEDLHVCAIKPNKGQRKTWDILINPALALFKPKDDE